MTQRAKSVAGIIAGALITAVGTFGLITTAQPTPSKTTPLVVESTVATKAESITTPTTKAASTALATFEKATKPTVKKSTKPSERVKKPVKTAEKSTKPTVKKSTQPSTKPAIKPSTKPSTKPTSTTPATKPVSTQASTKPTVSTKPYSKPQPVADGISKDKDPTGENGVTPINTKPGSVDNPGGLTPEPSTKPSTQPLTTSVPPPIGGPAD